MDLNARRAATATEYAIAFHKKRVGRFQSGRGAELRLDGILELDV
jgi:hypothetical protein